MYFKFLLLNITFQENEVIVEALKSNFISRLTPNDLRLFLILMSDIFITCNIITEKNDDVKENIRRVMVEEPLSLEINEYLINKTIQLKDSLNQRTGCIIVGPVGCGKSTIWKLLQETLQRASNKKIITYLLSPKSMHIDEFIGHYLNHEWIDGLFIKICRKVVSGPIDSKAWIILDVSRKHCCQIVHLIEILFIIIPCRARLIQIG